MPSGGRGIIVSANGCSRLEKLDSFPCEIEESRFYSDAVVILKKFRTIAAPSGGNDFHFRFVPQFGMEGYDRSRWLK
jgi:hypothetical protein